MPDESYLIDLKKEKLYKELILNDENNVENTEFSKKDKKLEEFDEENEESQINKNKDISLSSDDLGENNTEETGEKFYEDEHVEITTVISWKRRMVLMKYIFCVLFMLTKTFYINLINNIILKTIIIIIIDILTEEIILKIIFNEALLVAPLIVMNKVMKVLLIIANKKYKIALIIYSIIEIIDFITIIFIYPFIDKIEFLIYSKLHILKLKYANKFVYKLFNKIVIINNYLYNEEKWKEEYEKEINKYLNKKEEISLEPILRINYIFSIKLISIILNPITIYIFYFFKEETKIKETFSLKEDSIFIHYIIMTSCFMIPEILLQIILINIFKKYYDIDIRDYLEYCDFRYSIRESDFINMRETMEYGINKFWRSLDSLLFSSQFFINLFISSSSLILLFIGIIILTFYSYNPLGEPYLIFIFGLFFFCILFLHLIIKLIEYIGIFVKKNPPINKRTGKFLDFLEMENPMQIMKKSMTTKKFRDKFVRINKIWIIENLINILGIEDDANQFLEEKEKAKFNDKNELDLKLKQIYQNALNYEFVEKEIQQKKDLIKNDLEFMPYNQDNVGQLNEEYGIRLDISLDSNSDLPNNIDIDIKIKKIKKFFKKKENLNLKSRIIDIAKIWKNKAQEILKYKKWSVDVIQKKKKNKCERCNSSFNLQVYQNIPFEELVEDFISKNKGEMIAKYKWQKYFGKSQIFITLCSECGYIRNSQMVINKYLCSKTNKETKLRKIDSKIILQRLKKSYIKGIVLNWLFTARSSILLRKIERELKEENGFNKKKKKS